MADTESHERLEGLDLARFGAFAGMVLVNFKIAMGATDDGGALGALFTALQGRAAATFVVLAGIGLGISAARRSGAQAAAVTLRRAGFLLVLGLANALVFSGDILHYYAFYFLCGAWMLTLRSRSLLGAVVLLNALFVVMVLSLDYDAGWDWDTFTYVDLWTPAGFFRHLVFNGWHPVIPWLGFLLFGVTLGRLPLSRASTQHRLIGFGAAVFVGAELMSVLTVGALAGAYPAVAELATTAPMPPMPLYTLAGAGAACFFIGLCLYLSEGLARRGVLRLVTPAGRQTLTLYIAHIFVGMGVLEAVGMLGGQSLSTVLQAAGLFCLASLVYANVWARFFRRGPLESAMRKVSG